MIPPSALIQLATLGLTAEQAEAVVNMLEMVERATTQDSGAALEARRLADRTRKQASRDRGGTSRDRHVMSADKKADPPRVRAFSIGEEVRDIPPSSLRSSAPKGADDAKRGKRLSEDWTPNAGHCERADELGITTEQFRDVVTEFRNYWLSESGARARKISWDLTFTNRLNEQAKRLSKTRLNGFHHPEKRDTFAKMVEDNWREKHGQPTVDEEARLF